MPLFNFRRKTSGAFRMENKILIFNRLTPIYKGDKNNWRNFAFDICILSLCIIINIDYMFLDNSSFKTFKIISM